jgi:hypothetical protein
LRRLKSKRGQRGIDPLLTAVRGYYHREPGSGPGMVRVSGQTGPNGKDSAAAFIIGPFSSKSRRSTDPRRRNVITLAIFTDSSSLALV